MIWEYLERTNIDLEELNSLGKDGWELVSAAALPSYERVPGVLRLFFKRAVVTKMPGQ